MKKFFVPDNIYEDRIAICKSCIYYFKPTGTCKDCGCFMKIKARLAPMACSQNKWQKTTQIEVPEDLPQDIIDEIGEVWKGVNTGRAKSVQAKARMIELWNIISGSNYNTKTNCGSCISTCFDGIKKLYKKYNE